MKKNIVVLAALMLGAFSMSAQEATSAPSLSLSSSFGYESMYVFRGWQFADDIVTPAINLGYGNFYAGTWFAVAAEGPSYREMDLFAGYALPLGETFKLDIGATHYGYGNLISDLFSEDSNSLEGYVGASASCILSPAIYVYRDFDYSTYTIEGRLGHTFNLTEKLTLALAGSYGYVGYDDDGEDYTYYNLSANFGYAISEKSSFTIGGRFGGSCEEYIYGSYDDVDLTENAIWFGGAFTISL